MATTNPFDLLGEDDNDDLSQLIAGRLALAQKKTPAQSAPTVQTAKPAKLPSKPLPPAQAVREAKSETSRGGGSGGGRSFGRGRGGGGFNRDIANSENTFSRDNVFSGGYKPSEDRDGGKPASERQYGFSGGYKTSEGGDGGKPSERRGYDGPRGDFRGGRRGGFNNGEVGESEQNRRTYGRRSGTGRGSEFKRDGAGLGNWGTPTDEITSLVLLDTEEPVKENEKNVDSEKPTGLEDAVDAAKENPVNEPEEKEPENKEMTLEEYEKLLEEKRKALVALKNEERKVVLDKDLESMQQLSSKKSDDEIFVKLGSDKDKRKDAAEKEEKVKKSVSINEFLKPEGEGYNSPGGRGRDRGRGPRGGFSGSNTPNRFTAPPIDDVGQFPSLGAK